MIETVRDALSLQPELLAEFDLAYGMLKGGPDLGL